MTYIHQLKDWPNFKWSDQQIAPLLADIRHKQGRLLGRMESMGFDIQAEATLHTLTLEVVKSSEIEGEILDAQQVRSSIARKLGLQIGGLIPSERHVDGVVEMMIDATQHFDQKLTKQRLFGWHNALFPTGFSGMYQITVAKWRQQEGEPMQVISGPLGKEKIHFEAPSSSKLDHEMKMFLEWFNGKQEIDPIIKASIAHFWFVTIHPFDDGNGRIARAIGEMQLARADKSSNRFYSMSSQIRKERNEYYHKLESAQKGSLDITEWISWFLHCLDRAFLSTNESLEKVLLKSKFWTKHSSTEMNARQKQMIEKLMEDFFGNLNSSNWARMTKTSTDTALRDIQDLVKKGILIQDEGGGRNTAYKLNWE